MKYGHFDDKNREYVITNPKTPYPWINYLGNEDFFSLTSNTGGGYTFYKDAKFRRVNALSIQQCPSRRWRKVLLHKRRRHHLVPGLETDEDPFGQL